MKLPDTLVEACSPSTPAARLAELAAMLPQERPGAAPTALAVALARNPNTPPDILATLLASCPGDVLRNPMLPFLLLEDPAWVHRMRPIVLLRAVRALADPPLPFLVCATRHDDRWVRWEATNHIALAGELELEEWQDAVRILWRDYAIKAAAEEKQAISELVDLQLLPPRYFHATPLPDTESDLQAAHEAIQSGQENTLHYAATVLLSPATTPGVLLALVDMNSISAPWYWRALARHPKADTRLLTALTTTYRWKLDASLRRVVFHHPQADAAVREAAIVTTCQELNVALPLVNFAAAHASQQGYLAPRTRPMEMLPLTRLSLATFGSPPSEVETLADDTNRLVRAAARARLRGETFSWE